MSYFLKHWNSARVGANIGIYVQRETLAHQNRVSGASTHILADTPGSGMDLFLERSRKVTQQINDVIKKSEEQKRQDLERWMILYFEKAREINKKWNDAIVSMKKHANI